MRFFNLVFLFFTFISISSVFAMFETLDFDEARQRGGFKSPELQNTISLIPSKTQLSPQEIKDLTESNFLINLKTLNLKNQKVVDDGIINSFCVNPTFSRIINLNLSGTNITQQALMSILNSTSLGSIRDLPQISGRFGVYSSMIYITTEDVNIDKNFMNNLNIGSLRNQNFTIRYLQPKDNITQTASPQQGIKMLEVKNY